MIIAKKQNILKRGQKLFLHGYSGGNYIVTNPLNAKGLCEYVKLPNNYDNFMYSVEKTEPFMIRPKEALFGIGIYSLNDYICQDIVDDIEWLGNQCDKIQYINEREEKERKGMVKQLKLLEGKKIFDNLNVDFDKINSYMLAKYEINDCDSQTDYFNTTTKQTILLGFSKSIRDNFNEMRKFASLLQQTKHLSEKNPKYEHREKYSMGKGYYLKKEGGYSTGWFIKKVVLYDKKQMDDIYILLAESSVFNEWLQERDGE